jgi:hypothetical protein
MSNLLQVPPVWTQNMYVIINMKINHDEGEWKSVFPRKSADL